jgi:hypothetical protein
MSEHQPKGRDRSGDLGGGGGGQPLPPRVVEGNVESSGGPPQQPPAADWRESFLNGSPDAEQRAFREFARTMRKIQARVRGTGKQTQRGLHAKMLAGTTRASLVVEHAELTGGFLLEGKSYPTTVRFSSASSRPKSDRKGDLRGIALRVRTPDGGCDLLLTNAEVSHVRDAQEFMDFASAMVDPLWGIPRFLFRHPRRGVAIASRALRQSKREQLSLAGESFWSRAPFLLGGRPVRYQLRAERPCKLQRTADASDFLHADLRDKLAVGPVRYVLWAQPYLDEVRTPLEDSSAPWLSEPLRVAALTLARQSLPAPGSDEFVAIDALQFNPWNTQPEMRPIGSLNRARKPVYAASQEERARPEPAVASPLQSAALRVGAAVFRGVNKVVRWDKLPPTLGVLNLIALRDVFRRENLSSTDDPCEARPLPEIPAGALTARTADGSYNDLVRPRSGMCGARFGRNGALAGVVYEDAERLDTPDPRLVSERLLRRDAFQPATTLNLLAVAWIQFQAHDWFKHREVAPAFAPDGPRKRRAVALGVFPTYVSKKGAGLDRELAPAHENELTHWWDCSQLYGSSRDKQALLRGPSGTLKLQDGFLLPDESMPDDKRLPLTGHNSNWWIGLELMHTLFAREHNAICEAVRAEHPELSDDRSFELARLINVALMDKIHTVEWTPALLRNETLKKAMHAHWFGLLSPRTPADRYPKSELHDGIPGSPTDLFEVPFALTEEFVSVYRLHPMLPDSIALCSPETDRSGAARDLRAFAQVAFQHSAALTRAVGLTGLAYSLGLANAGSMTLHNYPDFLRHLPAHETRKAEIDLAAVDIFRDRERGVPRYNAFRQQFGLPRLETFADVTRDVPTQKALASLYRDVDEVDLMIGLLAERPPDGFGISDTAFRVFVGMASRRLKADRFITGSYRRELYTDTGLRWVHDNTFKSVLLRHMPELADVLCNVEEPFMPWTGQRA